MLQRLKVGDLITLANNGLLVMRATMRAFQQFCAQNNVVLNENSNANGMWWRFTEQYLAGTIGAASARTLLYHRNGQPMAPLWGKLANILRPSLTVATF